MSLKTILNCPCTDGGIIPYSCLRQSSLRTLSGSVELVANMRLISAMYLLTSVFSCALACFMAYITGVSSLISLGLFNAFRLSTKFFVLATLRWFSSFVTLKEVFTRSIVRAESFYWQLSVIIELLFSLFCCSEFGPPYIVILSGAP